ARRCASRTTRTRKSGWRSRSCTRSGRRNMRAQQALSSLVAVTALAAVATAANAQDRVNGATVQEQATLPVPTVEPPPRPFKTAEEHYNFLLERAHGGTKHTMQTIPVWDGLWGSGNNTMPSIFL